jgi:hypothetical protein
VICELHRVIWGRVVGSTHNFWLASILVCVLLNIWSLLVLVFFPFLLLWICEEPSSSFGVGAIWVCWRVRYTTRIITYALRCFLWSWSSLISFWVRSRKPHQNPNLNKIFDLRFGICVASVHTSPIDIFSLHKLSAKFEANLPRFWCPALPPLCVALPHPLFYDFVSDFDRELGCFSPRILVYSNNTSLNCTVIWCFVSP